MRLNFDSLIFLIYFHSKGLMIFSVLVMVVNLRLAIHTQLWNPIVHFVIWGTIVVFWLLIFGYVRAKKKNELEVCAAH